MTQICARCESQSIVKDYDYGRHCEYKKCQMCGSEKFKEKDLSKVTQNIPKIIPSVVKIVKKEEPMNKIDPEKAALIIEKTKEGKGYRTIAKEVDIAKGTAQKHIREYKEVQTMPKKGNYGRKISEEIKAAAMFDAETTGLPLLWSQYNEIGKKHGISGTTVWNWIQKKHGRDKAVRYAVVSVDAVPGTKAPVIETKEQENTDKMAPFRETVSKLMSMYQRDIENIQDKIDTLESIMKDLAA
jgi:transposase-like protein